VATYGHAAFAGDLLENFLSAPIVGAAGSPAGGYWLVGRDGGVFSFGSARFYGSVPGLGVSRADSRAPGRSLDPIVGLAANPDGAGYWEVAADGGVFAFGDARFFGSMGGHHLQQPVVAMAATPDGGGYWEVSADGGVFTFGDARFFGSTGAMRLNRPVVGMMAAKNGAGYRLIASDGGIFSFGQTRFWGSLAGHALPAPISAAAATPDDGGYWMVAANSAVYAFGDARFEGGGSTTMLSPGYNPAAALPFTPAVSVLSLPVGSQLTHSGKMRVAFAGDSNGWYEGFYTGFSSEPFFIRNDATPGCGVSGGSPLIYTPTEQVADPWPACSLWTQQFEWIAHHDHPDVVVLQLGYWECQARYFEGKFVTIADPAYADAVRSDLVQALTILQSTGASVIVNTSPYFGEGTPSTLVDDFNHLVQEVVDADGGLATVVDVNTALDPAGAYTSSIAGQPIRMADGIHITEQAVRNFIDPLLVPAISSLGQAQFTGTA
jgi:hypothetical protein